MQTARKILKIVRNLVWAVFLVFLFLVGIAFLPIKGNFKIFTVQSGSMEPTIGTGSVIFVLPRENYELGDIVTRTTENSALTVTHRIVEKDSTGGSLQFTTKGDANNMADPEVLEQSAIVGKMFFQIPYLGYPVGFARTARGLLLLIVIPSAFVIFDEILNIKHELQASKKRKRGNGGNAPAPTTAVPAPKFQAQTDNSSVRIHRIDTNGIPKEIRHL